MKMQREQFWGAYVTLQWLHKKASAESDALLATSEVVLRWLEGVSVRNAEKLKDLGDAFGHPCPLDLLRDTVEGVKKSRNEIPGVLDGEEALP